MNNNIRKIEQEAKKFFQKSDGCHDWTHMERVRDLALAIGRKEKADLEVLEVAALLHDIGREKETKARGKVCHAEESGKMARQILKKYYPAKFIDEVVHAIECHRFRGKFIPKTLEAKIIFDADKLDCIGAVGIAREFVFVGSAGSNCMYNGREKELLRNNKNYTYEKDDSALLEFYFKMIKLKDKLITKEGKRIGLERHKFMVEFFKRFEKEIAGKC